MKRPARKDISVAIFSFVEIRFLRKQQKSSEKSREKIPQVSLRSPGGLSRRFLGFHMARSYHMFAKVYFKANKEIKRSLVEL